MTEKEKIKHLNIIYLCSDIIEGSAFALKDLLRQEFKQKLHALIRATNIFVKEGEKMLKKESETLFNSDCEILREIIEMEIAATEAGKEKEFMEYLRAFDVENGFGEIPSEIETIKMIQQ